MMDQGHRGLFLGSVGEDWIWVLEMAAIGLQDYLQCTRKNGAVQCEKKVKAMLEKR